MRLNSFTSKDVQKTSFLTGYTIYKLSKKLNDKYKYNIRIEIGIIILLLGLYLFIAYSFLQASSDLLFLSNNDDETITYYSNDIVRNTIEGITFLLYIDDSHFYETPSVSSITMDAVVDLSMKNTIQPTLLQEVSSSPTRLFQKTQNTQLSLS